MPTMIHFESHKVKHRFVHRPPRPTSRHHVIPPWTTHGPAVPNEPTYLLSLVGPKV